MKTFISARPILLLCTSAALIACSAAVNPGTKSWDAVGSSVPTGAEREAAIVPGDPPVFVGSTCGYYIQVDLGASKTCSFVVAFTNYRGKFFVHPAGLNHRAVVSPLKGTSKVLFEITGKKVGSGSFVVTADHRGVQGTFFVVINR